MNNHCIHQHPPQRTMKRRRHVALPYLLLAIVNNVSASRVYTSRHAPSRPEGAPDIDYGGVHPFDAHRHLYDSQGSKNMRKQQPSQHKHEQPLQQQQQRRRRTQTHKTTPLHPPTDHLYNPLRIAFDTSDLRSQMELSLSAGDVVAATKLFLLIYEILPGTAEVWGDVLRVIPVAGGIYPLDAVGATVDVLLPSDSDSPTECSGKKCREYFEDPVRLLYCPDQTAGIGGGADLLIYATVNRHCDGGSATESGGRRRANVFDGDGGEEPRRMNSGAMGTLASALSCQRDQYDRPITGSIDFCLSGMGDVSYNFDVAQAIAQKEASGGGSGGNTYSGQATEKWEGWTDMPEDGESMYYDDDVSYNSGGSYMDNTNRATIQYSIGVAVHEIAHVLGVTSDSLRYFRHPLTGFPLTPRPFTLSTVKCVNGEEIAYVGKPGPNVMKEVTDPQTQTNHFEVITPTVRRIVQNQFNCPNATGAKLENQPTSLDCFGSHWDERLFYTEIMGAVFSQTVNVLSPLTVALLEDSGWYRANYESEYVQLSSFGHGAGCEFMENDCIDSYGKLFFLSLDEMDAKNLTIPPSTSCKPPLGNVPDPMYEQFCNEVIAVSSNGIINTDESGDQTCDPSHTAKTYCDLVDSFQLVGIGNQAILLDEAPPQFQYFGGETNLRPFVFTSADFCPIPHIDPQSCLKYDGRRITDEQEKAGEYYGPDSRCVETDGSRSYSLCLQTKCNSNLGLVQIVAGGETRSCEYDGQIHTILYDDDGAGPVRIKCPKASLVCPESFCQANCAGRGTCMFRPKSTISTSEPLGKCVCDSASDFSDGCFYSELTFPEAYGRDDSQNPYRANKTLFLVIVGSLVAGLAVIFVVVRQWKARQNVFM